MRHRAKVAKCKRHEKHSAEEKARERGMEAGRQ